MFRTALRSFSRPVRSNACRSCSLPYRGSRYYSTPSIAEDRKQPSAPSSDNQNETTTLQNVPKDTASPDDGSSKISSRLSKPGLESQSIKSKKKAKARSKKEKKGKRKPKPGKKAALEGQPEGGVDTKPSLPIRKVIAKTRKEKNDGKDKIPLHVQKLSPHLEQTFTGSLSSKNVELISLDVETTPVPNLSFGLDRVLFNPGVYHLRDPRSRVYNFDPYLGNIMPVSEFDFEALKEYITSSKDETLIQLARDQQRKYVGSSSSMTWVLSHFHYLLSEWRPINRDMVSAGFPETMRSFTRLLRAPAAMFLHYKDGVYAVDADKEFDTANILMNLGKSMEKLLTLSKDEFERYRKSSENKVSAEEEKAIPESYHYSTLGDFVMRSQLDAHDPRLPGTGMFDLKTRAVVSIRMDVRNFERGMGYEIKERFGMWESFEREYYDMIRAAFLKYSLQVRIGRMDGIFVAFHNIERIFGFQYIPLSEMDLALHEQADPTLGDKEFQLSIKLWNSILDKATARFPGKSLRLHFDTRDTKVPFMYIFAEPVTDEEIKAIQEKNKAEIEEYQRRLLHPERAAEDDLENAEEEVEEVVELAENDDRIASVESGSIGPEDDESTTTTITDESTKTEDPNRDNSKNNNNTDTKKPPLPDLMCMILTINSSVNGKPVVRPRNLSAKDEWTVNYELREFKNTSHIHDLYVSTKTRRQRILEARGEDENFFLSKLHSLAKAGRKFRKEQDQLDEMNGVVVYDPVEKVNNNSNSSKDGSNSSKDEQ